MNLAWVHTAAATEFPSMPRYYFNVHDGRELVDKVGSSLSDIDGARQYAVRYAGELLLAGQTDFWDGSDWSMDVIDEQKMILFTLHFMAVDSPAAKRTSRDQPRDDHSPVLDIIRARDARS